MSELRQAPVVDPELIDLLRADLVAADWTVTSVERLLGSAASAALDREQRVPGLLRVRENDSAAARLTEAFILGETVPLEGAFRSLTIGGAIRLGLIDQAGNPLVDLRPHSAELPHGSFDWWVASDRCEMQTGKPLRPEHVLGIGPATASLLRMTVRRPVERAMDLGTGCGIQALYLATHAERVIATDVSARACAFARFNAALNQANIDVRQGSLFDPVEGESFDLITSNPPFVITPGGLRKTGKWEYRDGGMDRDDLIKKVIEDGPGFLRSEGILQMLANWEVGEGDESWDLPVRSWLGRAADGIVGGLSAWVVMRDLLDVPRYAELWLRDSGGNLQGRQKWESDYRVWVEDFATAGVQNIAMGFLAIRRTEQPGLRVETEEIVEGEFPDGETVLGALEYVTLPDDWLDMRAIRASDVREVRYYVPGSSDPEMIQLTQGAGMGRAITAGSSIAALVGTADGELTVRQVATALEVLTDVPAEQVCAEIEAELPDLLRSGMVTLSRPDS